MPLPDPLLSNPPSLAEQLKRRTNELRSSIVRANYNTQFAQTAPELADFRDATVDHVNQLDDNTLSESFQKTVHFTTYDSYAPLLSKFFNKPFQLDIWLRKFIPKYNRLSRIRSSDATALVVSEPLRRRTTAYLRYLANDQIVVEDEDSCPMTTIYLSFEPSIADRTSHYLDPEKDEDKMGTFILDHAAPYAVLFIKQWRSFLLIHALFAVGRRSLETIDVVFINTFVEMVRHLDKEFDMMVDCIATGTIPDLDGIAKVRHHLEGNISPDPERAAELRRIGRPSSRPGWCGHVWPNLHSVIAISSGSFSSAVPLARWFLNPATDILARGHRSTECIVGLPYNPYELNQFKLSDKVVIELLDISRNDSIGALTQLWEAEVGRQYEVVLTTQDGLWRYRLADVIEVAGFDPTDGVPIVHFIERRHIVIRLQDLMFTEKELRALMSSVALNMQIAMANWTVTIDDRSVPETMGFFVELIGDQVSNLALAPDRLLDELLQSNGNVKWSIAHDLFRKPTIRVVRSGTFSEFLQLKLDEGGMTGQVKIPVVLPNAAYVTWFEDRVVQEF